MRITINIWKMAIQRIAFNQTCELHSSAGRIFKLNQDILDVTYLDPDWLWRISFFFGTESRWLQTKMKRSLNPKV